jgi:hypothetical protein
VRQGSEGWSRHLLVIFASEAATAAGRLAARYVTHGNRRKGAPVVALRPTRKFPRSEGRRWMPPGPSRRRLRPSDKGVIEDVAMERGRDARTPRDGSVPACRSRVSVNFQFGKLAAGVLKSLGDSIENFPRRLRLRPSRCGRLGRQRRQNRPDQPGDVFQLPRGGKGRRFSDRGVEPIQSLAMSYRLRPCPFNLRPSSPRRWGRR